MNNDKTIEYKDKISIFQTKYNEWKNRVDPHEFDENRTIDYINLETFRNILLNHFI